MFSMQIRFISSTRSEHPPDVSVPFVEPLLHDGVYEGRAVEEHALVALVVVLLGDLRDFFKFKNML